MQCTCVTETPDQISKLFCTLVGQTVVRSLGQVQRFLELPGRVTEGPGEGCWQDRGLALPPCSPRCPPSKSPHVTEWAMTGRLWQGREPPQGSRSPRLVPSWGRARAGSLAAQPEATSSLNVRLAICLRLPDTQG